MSRQGLVSYGGDSESETDPEESMSTTPPSQLLPGTLTNSLGISASKPRTPSSPPSFIKPVVHSAPLDDGSLAGLVAYGDDEEHNESIEATANEVFEVIEEAFPPGTESPASEPVIELEEELLPPEDTPTEDPPLSGPLFLPLSNVYLPPDPSAPCSKALQDKVKALLQKQALLGIDVNKSIQERKDFRNPSIYKKLIEFSNIDEFGSNYPEHLHNPHEWTEEDHYDSLSKAQKKAYEKKQRARHEKNKIEFVTGTKRSGGSQGPSPNKPSLLGPGPVGAQAKAKATAMKIT